MSACTCGLADSSILRPSYVVDLNRMVLCLYIRFCLMMMLSCSRPEKYSSSPSYGRPLMREYRWSRRRGRKSCVNTIVISQQQTKFTLTRRAGSPRFSTSQLVRSFTVAALGIQYHSLERLSVSPLLRRGCDSGTEVGGFCCLLISSSMAQ